MGLLALFLVASCDQSANRVSTLWTNVPEIASAVEKFNASQREWQLLVEYLEDPAAQLIGPGVKADLVIARGLSSVAVKDRMVSLDFLFDGGNLAKASFYQRSLEAGHQNDRIKLLPVSIDFPVLLYSKKELPDLPGFSLTIDDLKALNEAFQTQPAAKNQRRMGFSPRWGGFGPTFLQWSGASFQEGFQGDLSWNPALKGGLSTLQTWTSQGWDEQIDFQHKYLQADPTSLLVSGRIQFSASTLSAFFNRPWRERRNLEFRFLDVGGRALASDTTVWAGIPSSSLTRGAGERFLAWFFQAETQNTLIHQAFDSDERNFGLAQGISSFMASNAGALVEVFPELAACLPAADQIAFWPALPLEWNNTMPAILKTWIDARDADEPALRAALANQRANSLGP